MSPWAVPPGEGVSATDHFLPLKCSAWSSTALPGRWLSPTAQQLFFDVQRTANNSLSAPFFVPAWFGTATVNHFLPVQCST